ncbi:RHS repeat-associated core domain-containing protein [Sorangium sp. So ce1335]|uniref:RHS repeat-associated core domain-containing protein n=1 Tax=Sorangium sp. So ce1335 TaxID=3133335 RepID=UPI003F616562
MARTAPVPNIPAIPGMNPGVWIMGGGGGGAGGNGRGGNGSGDGQGAGGGNGGNDAQGGGKGAGSCGPGTGAGCPNPSHGGGGGTHAGDPIDPVTGRVYTVPAVDLALPGPLPLVIKRAYSSSARDRDVGLGRGWAHSLAWEIEPHAQPNLPGSDPGHPGCGEAARATRFVWDGDTLVHEVRDAADTHGNTVVHERTYSFLPRSRAPLAHRDALVRASGERVDGGWVHYINDPVGHPRALVSGQGEVLCRVRRNVWGQVDAGEHDQATTPLRFPGQYADDETGVVYNRYRYYDPETGRYISPDPLGLAGGLRPFGYASNRPLAMIDPDGLAPVRASVQGPYSNGPFGSSTDVRSGQRHYGGGERLPNQLHPAVQDALVPVYNGVSARGQADALPHYCAEPWAMTNYIRNYEHANGIPPDTMNPQHPSWNDCIGSIQSITAQQGQTSRIPCPNCSQMLANLGVQSHQVPPVNGQNFSPPDRGWASQHQGPVVHLGFR